MTAFLNLEKILALWSTRVSQPDLDLSMNNIVDFAAYKLTKSPAQPPDSSDDEGRILFARDQALSVLRGLLDVLNTIKHCDTKHPEARTAPVENVCANSNE